MKKKFGDFLFFFFFAGRENHSCGQPQQGGSTKNRNPRCEFALMNFFDFGPLMKTFNTSNWQFSRCSDFFGKNSWDFLHHFFLIQIV